MSDKNGVQSDEYLRDSEHYTRALGGLLEGHGEGKRFAVYGTRASTVSSWKKGALPNVVMAAAIAREAGKTVEEMVFGERPKYRHRTREICEIVELLESIAGDRDLVVELRGLVRRHIADHGQEETACTENAKNA